jgi:hypothetical protein
VTPAPHVSADTLVVCLYLDGLFRDFAPPPASDYLVALDKYLEAIRTKDNRAKMPTEKLTKAIDELRPLAQKQRKSQINDWYCWACLVWNFRGYV